MVKMELLDYGLTVSADLVGYVFDIHGIKGVKVVIEAAGFMVFFGRILLFGSLLILVPGGRHQW